MDEKSKKIITSMFWSSAGWKSEYKISDRDKEYLIANDNWYDNYSVSHDDVQNGLLKIIKAADRRQFAGNFLYSISTRDLSYRSALGSYAVHKNMRSHNHTKHVHCSVCGMVQNLKGWDQNILNFERVKWGGVRHAQMDYAFFDLSTSRNSIQHETEEDISVFKKTVNCISRLPEDARIRDAEKAIKDLLKSNANEREVFLQILGYCGILQPSEKPGYLNRFINCSDRDLPAVNKIDWAYPVCWWRGKDGMNREALKYYFGDKMEIDFV